MKRYPQSFRKVYCEGTDRRISVEYRLARVLRSTFCLNFYPTESTWCLWSALYKATVMTWTAVRSPARSSPPARRIKPSGSTPLGTSPSSRSRRSQAMATGYTAAASAPAASTWRPAPPMPPRWCGRWPVARSRPCSSIQAGVRSGCVPSHPTPPVWSRELLTAPWPCGTSRPELCAGQH